MRFIKLGLISAVFLFLVITAISLLLPSTINISRAIDINAPLDSVYVNVNDLSKWQKWFANYDSSNASFSPGTTGKGRSLIMGKTTVTILQNDTGKITTLWQAGSKSLEGEFNFFTQQGSSLHTLQWHFTQHVKWYPWEKFASIVTDKTIGPVMEKSLDNLKKLVEK